MITDSNILLIDHVIVFLGIFTTLMISVINGVNLRKAKAAITEVHLAVNSRLTELLEVTKQLAHAEGREEQRKNGNAH